MSKRQNVSKKLHVSGWVEQTPRMLNLFGLINWVSLE
jgi:hypothetical protein